MTSGTTTYAGSPASVVVSVSRNKLTRQDVTYAAGTAPAPPPSSPTTGGLALGVSGLPSGTNAAVTVTGPSGYTRNVTATTNLDGLEPGSYSITAQDVVSGVRGYRPSPASQSVSVVASTTRTTASVSYTVVTGELRVSIGGLPSGTNAAVTVTGPGGFSRSLTATTLITGLSAGSYTVAAASVSTSTGTATPSPTSQGASVTAGAETGASVTYTTPVAPPPPPPPPPPPSSGLNLRVESLYLVQAVQSLPDTVPLVANRAAYLRVFVTANTSNSVSPAVRVRLYQGSSTTPSIEYTLSSGRSYTPTSVRQDTLALTWNQLIPANYLQPGLRIEATVDPSNAVAESDEGDNVATRSMDVRSVNAFNVRFVPVTTSANGRTGNVTSSNMASYMASFRKLYPVQAVNAEVRAPYVTTTTLALQSSNGNGAWGTVLSEINALRAADGATQYYYGVVPTDYSSGVAGMGYVPGRSAIGWDRLPSGDGIFAHELGHNFSLNHAPCGGVSGSDPNYPYSGGVIGVYGFDVSALALKLPTAPDLMGYCSSSWISDYSYAKAFRYRGNNASAVVMGGTSQAGLLVWGRVVNGQVALEPAFELVTRSVLPARPGPYAIDGLDAQGRPLFSYAFDLMKVADVEGDEGHFAFVIPMSGRGALARLQVRGGATLERQADAGVADAATAVRQGRGARLTWNAQAFPMAMVRDAA
ncbi:MAG TPA: M66 family metalloprotease, partial [Gemmatimonadales bacterium]|nr:M66 family metalloprotease [Gemmatimonadales bacterium]